MTDAPNQRRILIVRTTGWFSAAIFLAGALSVGVSSGKAAERPVAVPADHAARMTKGLELFKSSVSGLLKEHCIECHGAGKIKGDFDLATREGLLKGGAEGVAVVAGQAAQSRLVKLISHAAEPHMPSKKPQLPPAAIKVITDWIDAGAPYDQPLVANAREVKDRSQVTDKDRTFWSFQPLRAVSPPAVKGFRDRRWVETPVDQFIMSELAKKGLQPNPLLDRRELIRRATFDLTGLPPTPAEVEVFVKDRSSKAYERLIERLLNSPQYGERWARHWLDLARYGESHGYEQDYDRPFAYHYRDFVIRALNEDLPYDQFVQWQIAGDELAPDNPQAWFATGFLGAGTHATQITANQAEKERYDELDDKIQTLGTAMLGLTIGCARCHDHKFDPIPTADYYRMISTFTTTVRSDHDVDLDPVRTRRLQAEFAQTHQPLMDAVQKWEQEVLPGRLADWLKSQPKLTQPEWLVLELEGFKASGGYYGINNSKRLEDGSWRVSITAGSPDQLAFTAKTGLTNLAAIRFEALADNSLPVGGPGWGKDGGFKLDELNVTTKPQKGDGQPVTVEFVRRRSTTEADGVAAGKAWDSGSKNGRDHVAVYEAEQPFGLAEGAQLSFTLKFKGNIDRNLIGRLRVAVAGGTNASLTAPAQVFAADFELARAGLAGDVAKLNEKQKRAAMQVYRALDAEWLGLTAAVAEHARLEPRPQLVKALVCSEGLPAIRLHTQGPDFYEQTFLLRRGDLAQKEEPATPGFLQVLMRPEDQEKHWQRERPADSRTPGQRAALARWLTDINEGAGSLLARVAVNRLWHHHFGRGIVATPSDFGSTGAAPTHPELLDWLARELIDHGWSLKHVHRLILTSAVYQQGTQSDPQRLAADPDNALWWRREPRRLEAEAIRDSLLAVSGQLDPTMYGPGTLDESMQRRSIYFFIKRSKLIPWMVQFDWPDSLQGVGRRVNTTVAPQALLMMNNPHVREAAKAFAASLLQQAGDVREVLDLAYRRALGRGPDAGEMQAALAFLGSQRNAYGSEPAESRRLALADYCQVLFSLNEFVYVE